MTDKPRSPLDTAAMRICALANAGRIPSIKIQSYWDTLTPMAQSIYRQTALEVFRDLARDPDTNLREGHDAVAVTR